jgi:hypothetical protein
VIAAMLLKCNGLVRKLLRCFEPGCVMQVYLAYSCAASTKTKLD